MNILFQTDYFLPHAGGARVYYFNLYKELVAHFPDKVTVLTKKVAGWEEFDRRESGDGMRIIRRFKPLQTWKYHQLPKIAFPLLQAANFLRKNEIDLLHFGDLYPPGMISLALKRFLRLPYVGYCHGEEITLTDRFRYQPAVRNLIYQNADAVVAASEYARQNLLRIGIPESRIHKIIPGVDCERFQPRPANPDLVREYSLEGKTVLLTVGRLCARKNHETVLRALAKLAPELPNLAYLIAGKGEHERALRRLVGELRLDGMVRFVGFLPEGELPRFYDLADVFVMPNREERNGDIEGFGIVFLEANAAGKPVVGGRSGGTAESVVHGCTGMLVDPDDVEALAAGLRFLLQNPDVRRHMGEVGLRRVRTEFSWARGAKLLHEISEEVVRASRACSRTKVSLANAT